MTRHKPSVIITRKVPEPLASLLQPHWRTSRLQRAAARRSSTRLTRVSIHPTEKDQFGIPVPYSHFTLFENDRRMMEAGITRAKAVLRAAGARDTHSVNRYAHLVGTCRMGFSPQDSVVDQWCRSWDVANLFVCDSSVLPTQGSSNPALTIWALAARTADWLRRAIPAGVNTSTALLIARGQRTNPNLGAWSHRLPVPSLPEYRVGQEADRWRR